MKKERKKNITFSFTTKTIEALNHRKLEHVPKSVFVETATLEKLEREKV